MNIVLITRENSERVTHVSVYLCGNYSEAKHFCRFVNGLSLAGGEKLVARKILGNTEYSLEKYQPFSFDDLVKLDNTTIQRIMNELDSEILGNALIDAKEEVKDVFFRNMSTRAGVMLEEDMEYAPYRTESDIEDARQLILDIYNSLPTIEKKLDELWIRHSGLKSIKEQTASDDRNHIVLVFRGDENVAGFVSVYLFDEYDNADTFCFFLNGDVPDKGSFLYARHADQMIEYETTKPLLISFHPIQIFELSRLEPYIIREVFKKFKPDIILAALKGMDKRSRMLIMQSLPTKTTDEINERIEQSDHADIFSLSASRKAQQRIINAINETARKFRER